MGGLVILYTTMGGIKAVTWADVQQMIVIMAALVLALVIADIHAAADVSFLDAVSIAGAAGKLNAVDHAFRLERPLQPVERPDRRNVPGAGIFRNAIRARCSAT